MNSILIWFFLFITSLIGCNALSNPSAESSHMLPPDYDKFEKPKPRRGQPFAEVYFRLEIVEINAINEAENYFELQINLYMDWADNRLVTEGVSTTTIPYKEIHNFWYPFVVFENIRAGKLYDDEMIASSLKITPMLQQISVIQRYRIRLFCKMKLANYPMDTQKCEMIFGAIKTQRTIFTPHWVLDMDPQRNPLHVELIEKKVDLNVFTFSLHETKKSEDNFNHKLRVTFVFKRRLLPSIVSVYFPSTLIVLVSFISFWVDINAVPGRVGIGVTAVLTIVTLFLDARKGLPPVSYITAIDIWLLVCISFVGAALVEFAVSHSVYQKKTAEAQRKEDSEKNRLEAIYPSRGLRFPQLGPNVARNNPRFIDIGYMPHLDPEAGHGLRRDSDDQRRRNYCRRLMNMLTISDPDRFSQIAYPLTFAVFCAMYWWKYLSST